MNKFTYKILSLKYVNIYKETLKIVQKIEKLIKT